MNAKRNWDYSAPRGSANLVLLPPVGCLAVLLMSQTHSTSSPHIVVLHTDLWTQILSVWEFFLIGGVGGDDLCISVQVVAF